MLELCYSGSNHTSRRSPAKGKDLHRSVSAQDDQDETLVWRKTRAVTANLVLHCGGMTLLLHPTEPARTLM